jgi:hypothetical protein
MKNTESSFWMNTPFGSYSQFGYSGRTEAPSNDASNDENPAK